jgi:hypothetical protein
LCPLAPNNVNTMACAALAAHNLGFDKVKQATWLRGFCFSDPLKLGCWLSCGRQITRSPRYYYSCEGSSCS